jgi:cytochrome c6
MNIGGIFAMITATICCKQATCQLVGIFVVLVFFVSAAKAQTVNLDNGKAEFLENCAACHPDGGNIIDQRKTLSKRDRQKYGIRTAADIIKIMRKPGERMMRFDEEALSEAKAKKIAEYILNTFK